MGLVNREMMREGLCLRRFFGGGETSLLLLPLADESTTTSSTCPTMPQPLMNLCSTTEVAFHSEDFRHIACDFSQEGRRDGRGKEGERIGRTKDRGKVVARERGRVKEGRGGLKAWNG